MGVPEHRTKQTETQEASAGDGQRLRRWQAWQDQPAPRSASRLAAPAIAALPNPPPLARRLWVQVRDALHHLHSGDPQLEEARERHLEALSAAQVRAWEGWLAPQLGTRAAAAACADRRDGRTSAAPA